MKVTTGSQTMEDALEALRKQIVATMRCGKHFCINLEKMTPEFKGQVLKGTNDITAETLFNHEEFWNQDISNKIAKEDENTN